MYTTLQQIIPSVLYHDIRYVIINNKLGIMVILIQFQKEEKKWIKLYKRIYSLTTVL